MSRRFCALLFGLSLAVIAGTGVAFADNINCKRSSYESVEHLSASAFKAFFPEQLTLNNDNWVKISGQKSLEKKDGQRTYQLLPNGTMTAKVEHPSGIGRTTVSHITYKCDTTPSRTRRDHDKGSSANATDQNMRKISDALPNENFL